MDKEWTIKYFKSLRGVNLFNEWLNTLSVKARAKIKRRIKYLEIEKTWKPYVKKLTGYTDLYEIKVLFNNIQYRLIGCFGKGKKEKEFIILIGAIEKGNKFEPNNAADTAYARSKLINKEEHISEY